MYSRVLFLLILSFRYISGEVVDIPNVGKLNGTNRLSDIKNRTIYEFKGIPYAKPPVGPLRFMPPVRKPKWEDVLDATQHGDLCQQTEPSIYGYVEESVQSEDCLFLDIYSPNLKPKEKLPVLFYIHGGGFIQGTSKNILPDYLLDYDIILAAPQYRLGPLGFMNLNGTNVTGNAGLYDQLMALEWVYDNIEHFGGDPKRITVSGVSAGAASAALLYLSPMAQDKVHQVMLFSGSALAPWVIDSDPVKHSLHIAELSGCNESDHNQLLSCLQEQPAENLLIAYSFTSMGEVVKGRHGMGGSTPAVDNGIIVEAPIKTMTNSSFNARPMLMSVTKQEGIFLTEIFMNFYVGEKHRNLTTIANEIGDIILQFSDVVDTTHILGAAVRDVYFPPHIRENDDAMIKGFIDVSGSTFFKGPALKMADLNSLQGGATFLTTFNYNSSRNVGIDHSSDQDYLFPYHEKNASDMQMVKRLTELYTNFVIYGTPTPNKTDYIQGPGIWEPYTQETKAYLCIDNPMVIKHDFEQEFTVTVNEKTDTLMHKVPDGTAHVMNETSKSQSTSVYCERFMVYFFTLFILRSLIM